MKADTVDLAAIHGKPVHYLVPLYQRPNVWTREDQWEPLWQDVVEVAERLLDDTEGIGLASEAIQLVWPEAFVSAS
jgi:hypothetical protein